MARKFLNVKYPDPGPFLEYLEGKNYRLLEDSRVFWTDEHGKEHTYKAKAGMIYDRSSIPQFLQSFTPKDGPKLKSSTIHDHQYETRRPGWSRLDMDRLFYAGLRAVGYSRATSWKHYMGARIGGYFVWNRRKV